MTCVSPTQVARSYSNCGRLLVDIVRQNIVFENGTYACTHMLIRTHMFLRTRMFIRTHNRDYACTHVISFFLSLSPFFSRSLSLAVSLLLALSLSMCTHLFAHTIAPGMRAHKTHVLTYTNMIKIVSFSVLSVHYHTLYSLPTRGGGLGSRPIFKKFHENYALS